MSSSSTSSSSPWQLLVAVARFAALPGLLLAALVLPMWWCGDALPIATVVDRQLGGEPILYGRKYYGQQLNVYKSQHLRRRKPTIAIVGSSRVMQFRAKMFAPIDEETYNAGGLLQGLADLEALATLVEQGNVPAPKVWIAGIDFWWLKQNADDRPTWLSAHDERDEVMHGAGHLLAARRFALAGPAEWKSAMFASRCDGVKLCPVGAYALTGDGFRADGSWRYGQFLEEFGRTRTYRDRETPPIEERARHRTRQFAPAPGLDSARVARLGAALERLKARSEVFVVLPPHASPVAAVARQTDGVSAYWDEYYAEVPEVLRAQGFTVSAHETAAFCEMADEAFFDGMHPGERVISHVLEELHMQAPAESALRTVDLEGLAMLRASTDHPLVIVDDEAASARAP